MYDNRHTSVEQPEKALATTFLGSIRTLLDGASGGDEGWKVQWGEEESSGCGGPG